MFKIRIVKIILNLLNFHYSKMILYDHAHGRVCDHGDRAHDHHGCDHKNLNGYVNALDDWSSSDLHLHADDFHENFHGYDREYHYHDVCENVYSFSFSLKKYPKEPQDFFYYVSGNS